MEFTVLIAEDDENDALLLTRVLTKMKVPAMIHIVGDGEEAITYMKGEGRYADRQSFAFPRVLITDLKMPRKNGFEVLEWLREHPEYSIVPVIVLSASKEDKDVVRCYQLGANAYFQKPAKVGDLASLVQTNFEFWSKAQVPPLEPFGSMVELGIPKNEE